MLDSHHKQKAMFMANSREALYFEQGKELVHTTLSQEAFGIDDPKEARLRAQEALTAFVENKGTELEEAAKRFKLFQRLEFIIGALVLIQMGIFLLRGEPYIIPLIFTATASAILYVVIAVLDSKAKGRRDAIQQEIKAAKRVKLKSDPSGVGVCVGFE